MSKPKIYINPKIFKFMLIFFITAPFIFIILFNHIRHNIEYNRDKKTFIEFCNKNSDDIIKIEFEETDLQSDVKFNKTFNDPQLISSLFKHIKKSNEIKPNHPSIIRSYDLIFYFKDNEKIKIRIFVTDDYNKEKVFIYYKHISYSSKPMYNFLIENTGINFE